MNSNFVDYVKIFCRAGNGGAGAMHLHREKYIEKGGPDGGNGGRGGHIILRGNEQYWTLIHLKHRRHVFAANGGKGGSALCTGANGEDIYVDVPLGTVCRNADTEDILFEITAHDEEKTAAGGGRGGKGNAFFKTSTRQTPRFAQPGEKGEEGWFVLELKLLADVGLVGFPNAGKSTLLSVVSAAKPKIAAYPFTTLEPNLGIVHCRNDRSFVMADIPGIIEGASDGRGLGLRFLRHIERNSALLFIVPADSPDISNEYAVLLNELAQYSPELMHKKRILAVSKTDLISNEQTAIIEKTLPPSVPHIFISSVAQSGIAELKDLLWNILNSDNL